MRCLLCGREVEQVWNDLGPYDPASAAWNDAAVDWVVAGYGSKHDMERFLVCICDTCLDSLGQPDAELDSAHDTVMKYASYYGDIVNPPTTLLQAGMRLIEALRHKQQHIAARVEARWRWLHKARWYHRLFYWLSRYPD
jgi:hypothetical protein